MNDGTAISFGPKTAWLAVATGDPQPVIGALELRGVRSCGWPEGIEGAYTRYAEREVFVTPVIDGWVLVVGVPISELEVDQVVELSRTLATDVLRFSTHRVVGHDAWVRATRGTLVRAYEYTGGEIVVEQGAITLDELEYGLADGPPEQERTVFALADDWSIDPSTLDERGEVGTGWRAVMG